MNEMFNSKLRSWLDDDSRTTEEGCLLLLQLEGNHIHYNNLMRYPDKKKLMDYLVSELSRRLTARLAKCTHEEVEQMDAQVKVIEKKYFLYRDAPTTSCRKRFRHDTWRTCPCSRGCGRCI